MNRNVKDGRTQIFVGAEKGHTAAIESLAKLGAEVNKAEKNGFWHATLCSCNEGLRCGD